MSASATSNVASTTTLNAIASQCVKCGLCLPHCPTYRLHQTESESPRGRIAIAQAVLRGAAIDVSSERHLASCLACGACESACPSQVRYQSLIVGVRAHIHAHQRESLRRRIARGMLERAGLMALLRPFVRAFYGPLQQRLRRNLQRQSMSPVPNSSTPIATDSPRSIALLTGCTGATFEAPTLQAAAVLLERCGHQVHQISAACCGALAKHSGDLQRAEKLGDALIQSVAASHSRQCTNVVTGCAAQCMELMADTSPYRDPMLLLWSERNRLKFSRDPRTVALHLPCTQRSIPDSVQATVDLLSMVPGLKLIILPHRGRCCGGAGSYFIDHPHTSAGLRQPILDDLAAVNASLVLSANVGCRIQIAKGCGLPIQHPLEFLHGLLET